MAGRQFPYLGRGGGICPIPKTLFFDHACKLGLEGIVCKRIDLPYRPGPSKSWIKVKNKNIPRCCGLKRHSNWKD
jgi:hypothetical protein